MEHLSVADLIGWVGAVLLLVAYALLSFKRIAGDSLVYQVMNILAGVFLAISSFSHSNYPLVFVNSFWSVIGVVAVLAVVARNGKNSN